MSAELHARIADEVRSASSDGHTVNDPQTVADIVLGMPELHRASAHKCSFTARFQHIVAGQAIRNRNTRSKVASSNCPGGSQWHTLCDAHTVR